MLPRFGLPFFKMNKQPTLKTGELKLGEVSKQIPWTRMPDDSGDFLFCKLNDHPDLVEEGAFLIAQRIHSMRLDNPCFVTPEASTIAIAHVLRQQYDLEGLVLYKNKLLNDIDPVSVTYDSVTATDKKQLFLGLNRLSEIENRDIIIIDSICTTGGTIRGACELLLKAGIPADRIKEAMVLFVEGAPRDYITMNSGETLKLHSFSTLPVIQEVSPVKSIKFDNIY
ncbi:MAG: phosphoribosyltransferase family protein [Gammaproteobacteria bacterium]|nr:phosphoribosyltransferase family protein [Gammaproteobacteria bacterium]